MKPILILLLILCSSKGILYAAPDTARLSQTAYQYSEEKAYDKAIAIYNKLLSKYPSNGGWVTNRARCYMLKYMIAEALIEFTRAKKIDPKNHENYLYAALCLQELKYNRQVYQNYLMADKLSPENGFIQSQIALYAYAEEDYSTSVLYFKKIIDNNKNDTVHPSWYSKLARALARVDQHEEMMVYVHKYLQLRQPDSNRILYDLLKEYRAMDNYKMTIEIATMYIERSPNGNGYGQRSYAYYKTSMFFEALEDVNKAMELDPGWADYYHLRFLIYSYTMRPAAACDDLKKAVELARTTEQREGYQKELSAYCK